MPLFAAPGDQIKIIKADWDTDAWGLAYDTLQDRMVVYHDRWWSVHYLWQVEVDTPHTASQVPLQNFNQSIKNFTGGTVLPDSGDIYAVERNDDAHGPTIARYDTNGDLQAFWRVNANFSGGGCSGGSLADLNDLARDPDNPDQYLVTEYFGGNILYRLDLGDTSGGPFVPSQCTLVETISLSNLNFYFGHVMAIEYDPIYEGYWVAGPRSPHVVLLDKNFEVVRHLLIEWDFNEYVGISPMNNVAGGEPYELWLKQYTTHDVVVVESGAVKESEADIQVTKDDGIDEYFPGQTIPYAVTVTNAGPDAAEDVVIVDNAPSTTIITSWDCQGTNGAVCPNGNGTGDLNETVPLLPAGGTLSYTVNVLATTTGEDLTNTANATATTADPDTSNNSASDTDTSFGGFAGVAKTDGRFTYTPGEILEYVIVVANRSGSDITNSFRVQDAAPAGTSVYYWACTDSNGDFCGNGFSDINQAYTGLANNTALFIVLQLQVDADRTGLLTNTVTLTGDAVTAGDFDVTSFSDTDARTVFSDLAVTKDDGQDTYLPGGSTTYTITVTNNGPSYSTNVNITDTAPDGTTIGAWSCSPAVLCPNASGTGDIDETVAVMVPGETLTYTVPLTISPTFGDDQEQFDMLVNGAAVTGDGEDPIQTNNSATDANERASADISVTKTDGDATYTPGGSTTYTITVENAGPHDAINAVVTDTAPADGTISSWTCTASGGAACPNASGTGDIAETAAILPTGGQLVYSVGMDIDAGASGTFTNTATVDSDTDDPDVGNNSASDADNLPVASADLSVSKTDSQAVYSPNEIITYTVTVDNDGPDDAVNVNITDTAPADGTISSWTCTASGGAACPNAGGTGDIAETAAILPTGGQLVYSVDMDIDAGASGTFTNTATVGSDTDDPDGGNNSATDANEPASADLSVSKIDGQTTYMAGETITYTVTVQNDGPDDAVNVSITDTAPADGTISSWTCTASGGAACPNVSGSGDILEYLSQLPAGGALIYTLDMTVSSDASGTLTNTATVDSHTVDPDEDNNSATDANARIAAIPTLSVPGLALLSLLLALAGWIIIGRQRISAVRLKFS